MYSLKLYPRWCTSSKIDPKNHVQPVLYFPGWCWWCLNVILQLISAQLDWGLAELGKITIQTHSNTSSNGPIEFHLVPDPEKFTDASSVKLHWKVGIHYKNSDGVWENVRKLPNTPKFGVINNFFSSLISSCVVKVNDCEIGENSSNSYPYMSYLQTLLGTSASQSGCKILEERAFYKDEPNRMESPDLNEDKEAFFLRRKRFTERDWTDFNIPLHTDLLQQNYFTTSL